MTLVIQEPHWETLLREVAQEYFKLILIVGESRSGKSELLKEIVSSCNFAYINMGEELSQKLSVRPIDLRPAEAEEIAAEIIAEAKTSRVAIDNTEVIFEYPIRMNPLRFLKTQSQQKTIVATWSGSLGDNEISYGASSHPSSERYSFNVQDTFRIITTPRF